MYNINSIKIKLLDETSERLTDISDDVYFGSAYKQFISNSSMSLINPEQGGSPTKFLEGFPKKSKNGGALELGTAVHRMLLEKDQYYIDDLDKPSPKVCQVMDIYFDYITQGLDSKESIIAACVVADYYAKNVTQVRIDNVLKEGKAYLEAKYDLGKCEGCITLTREHKDKLDKCLASVKTNDKINELLMKQTSVNFGSYNEDVLTMKIKATLPPKGSEEFEDKVITLNLKAKIDNWSIDFINKVVTLNDLKTTGTSVADFVGFETENMNLTGEIHKKKSYGSFEKFHYYRQMALYMRILKAYVANAYDATEEDGWTFKCHMLVVETNAPHYSHVFEVGDRWMKVGTYEYESLIKRIAYHEEFGYNSFTNIILNGTTMIW